MADEQFRLRASIDDQLSAPLMKLRQHLGNIKPTPEMKAVRSELDLLQRTVERINKAGGPTGDVLGGFGFNLSAAAGITAVANSMRNLAQQSLEMRHVSRETGLAANELRALQKTGERFQIAPESVTQNMQSFADKMNLLRRGLGETAGITRELAPGLFGQLKGSASNLDALDKALSFLGKIKDPQDQRRWADTLGLGDMTRMFTDGPEAMAKAWKDARSKVGKDGDFSVQAKEVVESMRQINEEWDKLMRMSAPAVFKDVAQFAKDTNSEIQSIKRAWDAISSYVDKFGTAEPPPRGGAGAPGVAETPEAKAARERMAALEGRRGSIQQQLDLLNRNPGAPDYALKRDRMTEELKRVGDELQKLRESGGATLSPTAFGGGGGMGGLIHTAGWGGITAPMYRRMAEAYNASPQGRTQRAIAGMGGDAVPGGSGGGAGAAHPDAAKALGDAIAGTESGRGGYNTVLGNGRYGLPPKPLTSMTLDEAYAFGREVRARHGSSSALGRYQIIGTTMRAAQRALGLPGDAMFDQSTQDQMMRWIARRQGLGAWEGLKGNPRAMAAARAAMAAGGAQDGPSLDEGASPPGRGSFGRFRAAPGWRSSDHPGVPHGSMLAPGDDGMLARARRAGLAGGSTRLDGSIGATVTFRNPPPGMSVKTETSGVVKEKKVDRGSTLGGDFSEITAYNAI